jgi:transposase-like protein
LSPRELVQRHEGAHEESPIHRRADGDHLREADQRPIAEVAKKHGVSDQTIYAWRKRFGTLEPADVRRLRQLEQENGRLKKMVADRDLEIDVLKEITRKKW